MTDLVGARVEFPQVVISKTLAHFRIDAELGAGGMGEVYRARDTKLDRDVAIKVLPEAFVGDRERLERFQREARLLANVNHPNIAAVYEVGEEQGTHFLVMEIAAGETVGERLSQGPMGIEEALATAVQIAAALEAAHRNGVVHRDLKPANVMVDDENRVKVLDFGLGKLVHPAPGTDAAEALSEMPTLTEEVTRANTLLGTTAYMSPEQINLRAIDQRTDVWSFGCTLYQMLVGRPPFRGESTMDILTSILHDKPDLDELPTETPSEIRRLLERCLRRDRNDRLQSMGDARIVIEDVLSGRIDRAPTQGPARANTERSGPVLWRWIALAAVVAAAALAARLWVLSSSVEHGTGAPGITFLQLTEVGGVESTPSLSPDQRSVAFAGDEDGDFDIYIQRLDGRRAINLTEDSPDADRDPAYSRDGTQVAFRSERLGGGIFVMGATGESVKRVTDFGHHPSWSPSGAELVVSTERVRRPDQRHTSSQLWVVDIADGSKRLLHEGDAVQPAWSPKGERIAYWGLRTGSGQRDIWTLRADGSEPVAVTNDPHIDWSPAWSSDGSMLYFLSDRNGAMNVWRIEIDERTGEPRGEPEAIMAPTRQATFLTIAGDTFAYADLDRRGDFWSASFDPVGGELDGPLEPVTLGNHDYGNIHISPDGGQVAFVAWGVQQDILVSRADGTGLRRLMSDVYRDRFPRWSPDGSRLLFYSDRSGRYEVWSIAVDGSGLEQHTETSGSSVLYAIWSPDGARAIATKQLETPFLFDPNRPAEQQEIQPLPPFEQGWFQPSDWSPDGRLIAGLNRLSDGSTAGILVYSLENESYELLRQIRSPPGGLDANPRWMPDSQRVLFLKQEAIYRIDLRTREVDPVLAPLPGGRGSFVTLDLSQDGRQLFVIVRSESADLWSGRLVD